MKTDDFRQHAHALVDWMADYLDGIENYPVRSQVKPGEIQAKISRTPPLQGTDFEYIFEDFKNTVMPGITHWQHPEFFAYFPGNSSPPSVLAEMLMATLGANAMLWQTSPAATEMEIAMVDWLQQMMGLPEGFEGSIQTTASESTLSALLVARERATGFAVNQHGFEGQPRLAVYFSEEAHSSLEKDLRIAGYGAEQARKIPADENFAMDVEALERAILADKAKGYKPACVIATLGTTGVGGIDPLKAIADICTREGIYLHVDAAWAGTALLLPEWSFMIKGVERADSLVFNPHKWMLTNFDCSVHFVRDKAALIRTFSILPEYLKGPAGAEVTDFRDWGVALGRRFRALKLWFVIRSYGVEGIQASIKSNIELARTAHDDLVQQSDFEITSPLNIALFTFRHCPVGMDEAALDAHNAKLLTALNDSGQAYFTQTLVKGRYAIRWQVGQPNTEIRHIEKALKLVKDTARSL